MRSRVSELTDWIKCRRHDIIFSLVVLTLAGVWNFTHPSRPGLWDDVVAKSPLKPRPRINLASALAATGIPANQERALAEYTNAVRLAVNRPAEERTRARFLAATGMSKLLIDMGRFDDAYAVTQHGFDEFPGFPGLAINLANMHMQFGHPELAVAVLTYTVDKGFAQYPWFPGMDKALVYRSMSVAYGMLGKCADSARNEQLAGDIDHNINNPNDFSVAAECTKQQQIRLAARTRF